MNYNTLGKSKLEISEIVFGAWAAGGWMWGGNDEKDAIQAIQAAVAVGVTSIDTAPAYGQGRSEEIVGKAIAEMGRDKIQILTKYGLRWNLKKGVFHFKSKDNAGADIDMYKYGGKDGIMEEVEQSLRLLKTDYIDLYQIHWPDLSTPIEETMEAMELLIQQGKIRYAGVCNYSVEQMAEAAKYTLLASNQIPYSMIKRSVEADVLPYAREHNIGILAYSPLERGLLTGKMQPGHVFAEGDHRANLVYFKEENLKRTNAFLSELRDLALTKQCTLSQLVLRWTLSQPGITAVLVGARNAEQAVANAAATHVTLTKEEVTFITERLNQLEINWNA